MTESQDPAVILPAGLANITIAGIKYGSLTWHKE